MSELLLTLVNRSLAACRRMLAIVLLRPFLRSVSPSISRSSGLIPKRHGIRFG